MRTRPAGAHVPFSSAIAIATTSGTCPIPAMIRIAGSGIAGTGIAGAHGARLLGSAAQLGWLARSTNAISRAVVHG